MARAKETWTATISTSSRAGSLVSLGGFAVPPEVTMRLNGDKTLPPGRRWPDIVLRFEVRDGAAACTEVRIVSSPGDRPIRTGDLAVFNLDALAEFAFERHAMEAVRPGVWAMGRGTAGKAKSDVRRAVDNSYSDPLAELREVARVYLDPAARRKPTRSVMDVLGYNSRETASHRVKAARDAGLIPRPDATDDELDAALRKLNEDTTRLGSDPIPAKDFNDWWESRKSERLARRKAEGKKP